VSDRNQDPRVVHIPIWPEKGVHAMTEPESSGSVETKRPAECSFLYILLK
jgi:hypothetical protein